jgi:hypothetical protein
MAVLDRLVVILDVISKRILCIEVTLDDMWEAEARRRRYV